MKFQLKNILYLLIKQNGNSNLNYKNTKTKRSANGYWTLVVLCFELFSLISMQHITLTYLMLELVGLSYDQILIDLENDITIRVADST